MILEIVQGKYLLQIGGLCKSYLDQLSAAVKSDTPAADLPDFRTYLSKQDEATLCFSHGNVLSCQIPTEPFALGWSVEKVRDCCGERPALEAVAAALLYDEQPKEDASFTLPSKTFRTLEGELFQFHWRLALTLTAQFLVDSAKAEKSKVDSDTILRALASFAEPGTLLDAQKKKPPKCFLRMIGHLNRISSTSSGALLTEVRDNTYTYRRILYDVFFQLKKAQPCAFSVADDHLPTALLMDQTGKSIDLRQIVHYSLLAALWGLLPPDSPTPIQPDALKWHGFKKTATENALKTVDSGDGRAHFTLQTLSGTSFCTLQRRSLSELSPYPEWWQCPGSTYDAYHSAMLAAKNKLLEKKAEAPKKAVKKASQKREKGTGKTPGKAQK